MSQKKVDEYRKYKKNRREIIKKEKRRNRGIIIGIWAFVVVVIAGTGTAVGVSLYNKYQEKLAALPTYASTQFILGDAIGITSGEEQESSESESEAASEAESAEDTEAVSEEAAETAESETTTE